MLKMLANKIFLKKNMKDTLVSDERLVPEFQQNAPWLNPHYERYRFASKYLVPSDTCLDLACGAGYGSDILAQYCQKVVGIDRSQKTIDYAQGKYSAVEYVCDDFFYNSFFADVVVSFETIEHIEAYFDSVLLSLVARAKKLLIGSFPYLENIGNPYHKNFFLTEKHILFLKSYGTLDIFFQEKEPLYGIFPDLAADKRQNIIFVLNKTTL